MDRRIETDKDTKEEWRIDRQKEKQNNKRQKTARNRTAQTFKKWINAKKAKTDEWHIKILEHEKKLLDTDSGILLGFRADIFFISRRKFFFYSLSLPKMFGSR